jgi:DNA polymerase III subunit epsilon
VPWAEEGLGSAKLDYLLSQFGFFHDGHRAMDDCRAVLHLLSLKLPSNGRAILPLLLANARQRVCRIWALKAPMECKDLLKQRGYRWNGGEDGRPRAWYRDVDKDLVAVEEGFLAEEVYGGDCRHSASGSTTGTASAIESDHRSQRVMTEPHRAMLRPGPRCWRC